ncbi:hypothetical protein CDD81_5355 [Ophiocordyceps australis]|uniref:Uncharacterized protein n=1 Tax=Ophiocordyceps australis TaxID=1399860 RepID=A0A2C5Y5D6_9HYPO|nr:hypothetical protein CDD81_5355 [Ophiocordyceps australis]
MGQDWLHLLRQTARQGKAALYKCPICEAEIQAGFDAFKAHVQTNMTSHSILADDADIEKAFKNAMAPKHSQMAFNYSPEMREQQLLQRYIGSSVESQSVIEMGEMTGHSKARLVSHDKLAAEVKGIYTSLPMIESKCIEYDSCEETTQLSPDLFEVLLLLHSLPECEHSFSGTRHPSVGGTSHPVPAHAEMEREIPQSSFKNLGPRKTFDGKSDKLRHTQSVLSMVQCAGLKYPHLFSVQNILRFLSNKMMPRCEPLLGWTAGDWTTAWMKPNARQQGQFEWRINGCINDIPISALADTGATCVAISKRLAKRLNLKPEPGIPHTKFKLPCGQLRKHLGIVPAKFTFANKVNGKKERKESHSLQCSIVPGLEHDLVLPFEFLRDTETLSRHRHRLQQVPVHKENSLRYLDASSAGKHDKRARLRGFVGNKPCVAVPDTGSTIMAMSASYATMHDIDIDVTQKSTVRFADGTKAITMGMATATWAFEADRDPISYEWHILEGLEVDAVLSIEFIKRHNIFGGRDQDDLLDIDMVLDWDYWEIYGICQVAQSGDPLGKLADDFYTDSMSLFFPHLMPLPASIIQEVVFADPKWRDTTVNSPDRFTYPQRVKEYARREEIQNLIVQMPAAQQEAAQEAEKARQRYWDKLQRRHILGLNRHLIQHNQETVPLVTATELKTEEPSDKRGGRWWKVRHR